MEILNDDVLEKIFNYLDFRSLIAAEMACKRWQQVINERRLFWQLSKSLCRMPIPKVLSGEDTCRTKKHASSRKKRKLSSTFDKSVFRAEQRKLKQHANLWPSRRK